jgi:hypothetical protein
MSKAYYGKHNPALDKRASLAAKKHRSFILLKANTKLKLREWHEICDMREIGSESSLNVLLWEAFNI